MGSAVASGIACRRVRVRGQVQGVGFRPFVVRWARELGLVGHVGNDEAGVFILVQGAVSALDEFERDLPTRLPPLARIDHLQARDADPHPGLQVFEVQRSRSGASPTAEVTPDAATCEDCQRELFDPTDRRARYALINCTNCGPRYTIVTRVPYDRPHTTMAGFPLCPPCAAEYEDVGDRRFHAQPVACEACGPHVQLVDRTGEALDGDPIEIAAQRLEAGEILAIKGLGGFHLACRADDEAAVAELRRRKQRDSKPFALMVDGVDTARDLVAITEAGLDRLRSPAAPIVLAPRLVFPTLSVAPSVAGESHRLGVMLPYTPLHHLLFAAGSFRHLVMTSGNVSDEPLVITNDEALERLGPLCDALLWHDRPIARAVDDTVWLDQPSLPFRRARGCVPGAVPLPVPSPAPGLALGGELKNTAAAVRDGRAILGQHIGDLKHPRACENARASVQDLVELFGIEPEWVAHDLHPLYETTHHAHQLSEAWDVPRIGVQHHHAHAASVLAEHGETGPALAIVCDGTGWGSDGTVWGGELLRADLVDFDRLGHVDPLWLIGGDAAAEDPRRSALALLETAYPSSYAHLDVTRRLWADRTPLVTTMLRRRVHCVPSTGLGRWFDGVAALLGLVHHNDFEARAAMALEAEAARGIPPTEELVIGVDVSALRIHPGPLVRDLVRRRERGERVADLAAYFHDQLARAWAQLTRVAARREHLDTVALSGGVFCNAILTEELTRNLQGLGLRVLRHEAVPPNDGGLALGQAAVAAARFAAGQLEGRS